VRLVTNPLVTLTFFNSHTYGGYFLGAGEKYAMNFRADYSGQTIRADPIWRFNWGVPVVAKY
jgi:hypothetical protein